MYYSLEVTCTTLPSTHHPLPISSPLISLLLYSLADFCIVGLALCWHSAYKLADTCKAAQPDTLTNLHTHAHSIHTRIQHPGLIFFMLHKSWSAFNVCRASMSVGN